MEHDELIRLLAILARELEAEDARLEIGGRSPSDGRFLVCALPGGWRVVVTFTQAPEHPKALQARLRDMLQAFDDTIRRTIRTVPRAARRSRHDRLTEVLCVLAERTRAVRTFVIDAKSPMIWGSSDGATVGSNLDQVAQVGRVAEQWASEQVDLGAIAAGIAASGPAIDSHPLSRTQQALRWLRQSTAGQEPSMCLALAAQARALAWVRDTAPDQERRGTWLRMPSGTDRFGCMARSFAEVYRAVLAFDDTFSPLHAEAQLLRLLPRIERLVLSLPPADPAAGAAQVVPLRWKRPRS